MWYKVFDMNAGQCGYIIIFVISIFPAIKSTGYVLSTLKLV